MKQSHTLFLLPRRTYTLIRVDGKNFHTYTRGCERPYDLGLMEDMDATALALCENLEGAQLAFVQSDEISVLSDGLRREAHRSLVRRQRPETRVPQRIGRYGAV